jgi:hypothetical protein
VVVGRFVCLRTVLAIEMNSYHEFRIDSVTVDVALGHACSICNQLLWGEFYLVVNAT